MRTLSKIGLSVTAAILAFGCAAKDKPASSSNQQSFKTPTLITDFNAIPPDQIISRAHVAAGGPEWTRPKSLAMTGYGVFYKDGKSLHHQNHKMWRVYDASKTNAHQVDGKVRIYSARNGKAVINISYDGSITYTDKGPQPKSAADKNWASNFGFGVIRHALDDSYSLTRLPDDLVDGHPVYMVKVIDLAGGETQFAIAQKDFKILKVGFDTERGWHERIYSDFYSNSGDNWVQPGRVRLYYNGVKANEVIWESYAINQSLPDCLFVLPQAEGC